MRTPAGIRATEDRRSARSGTEPATRIASVVAGASRAIQPANPRRRGCGTHLDARQVVKEPGRGVDPKSPRARENGQLPPFAEHLDGHRRDRGDGDLELLGARVVPRRRRKGQCCVGPAGVLELADHQPVHPGGAAPVDVPAVVTCDVAAQRVE